LSEKKTTLSIYASQEWIEKFLDAIHFSEQQGTSNNEKIIAGIEKYVLNKNSPAVNSPASEKPQSDIPTNSLSLQERAKQNPALKEALENINQPLPPPPCHYLAKGYIDKKTGITYIFCNGEKMPLTVCMNLYERHRAKNKQCIPQNIKAQQKKKFEQKYLRHPKVDWDTNPWG
jgi:hypothetical protein